VFVNCWCASCSSVHYPLTWAVVVAMVVVWLRKPHFPPNLFPQVNSYAFPPVDDALSVISRVDYNKLLNQFVMLTATVLAIIVGTTVWFYNRARQWYQAGGKEQVLDVINRAAVVINNQTGLIDKISAQVVKFYNRVEFVYHSLTDLAEGAYKV